MITPESSSVEALSALLWFFGRQPDNADVMNVLHSASCQLSVSLTKTFGDKYDYILTLFVQPDELSNAGSEWFHDAVAEAFPALVHDDSLFRFELKVKVVRPEEQRTTGINNCFFNQERTIPHDGLRFRSKGEIAIYEELKRRNVLFFPNPAAVLGTVGTEFGARVAKKEPDFLICYKGKWGILEINGDDYHNGVVQTARDHDRARQFQHYGVFFIQAYDLNRCKKDPMGVVDEFLKLLADHK
jgi:hypothetical protein